MDIRVSAPIFLMTALLGLTNTTPHARGDIVYVDASAAPGGDGQSWLTALDSLQNALLAASTHSNITEIRVAAGSYRPDLGAGLTPGDVDATFQLVNGVSVLGGFPAGGGTLERRDWEAHPTVLLGDLLGDDIDNVAFAIACDVSMDYSPDCPMYDVNSNGYVRKQDYNFDDNTYHLVDGSNCDETTVLDGFTLTRGASHSGCYPCPYNDRGAAITVIGGHPTIRNCVFETNIATYHGAAIYIEDGGASISDCRFESNGGDYGAAFYALRSTLSVQRCIFKRNIAAARGGR